LATPHVKDRAADGRREPTIAPPASFEQPRSVNAEERRKLQSALDELVACRQIIDSALAG
jgi:hypothetical protein